MVSINDVHNNVFMSIINYVHDDELYGVFDGDNSNYDEYHDDAAAGTDDHAESSKLIVKVSSSYLRLELI